VPFDCRYRRIHGPDACFAACAATELTPVFRHVRVDRPGGHPPAEPAVVDVALLDMHHGWPNLGHDALVHAVQNAVCDVREGLAERGLAVRVVSYDVRRGLALPPPPGRGPVLYLGSGGPGHLDPRRNDGIDPGSQGIAEDPAWEAPLFRLFDAIAAHPDGVLLGVCHTFGVMCRWLGGIDVVLRGPEKGGKSAGIVDNVLTDEAVVHPWFGRFAEALPDRRHFPVLDSRLYDLVPRSGRPGGAAALAREARGPAGPPGDALTMIEVARASDRVMPRMLGVNHHPEIVNRPRQLAILRKKLERGEVTHAWYEERARTLTEPAGDPAGDRLLHLTSSYSLMGPLRLFLYRAVAERAAVLGRPLGPEVGPVATVDDLMDAV
jgi:hypothetical protein